MPDNTHYEKYEYESVYIIVFGEYTNTIIIKQIKQNKVIIVLFFK